MSIINVTIWNEGRHEKTNPLVSEMYPNGLHGELKSYLDKFSEFKVTTTTLDDSEQGLPNGLLENTDVLIWWGHMYHDEVDDKLVECIHEKVLKGMGLICLHSAHHSKIFKKLMGTSCNLRWNENGNEKIWTLMPSHPIAEGIPPCFELEHEEMYGEFFDIPQPHELVFAGWFNSGETFRSGCTFHRGYGKVFYFQPGHETNTAFKNENVLKIIKNALNWAKPRNRLAELSCIYTKSV